MKLHHLSIALVMLSSTIFAQGIDISKSSLTWKGTKTIGDSYHEGPISIQSATLQDGKGKIIVDMTSIDDTTLKGSWKKKFLGHIKSGDFFDVGKYPTSTLTIQKIDNGYLHGELTIKDSTLHVSIPVTKDGNTYTGELGFDRTKYGMIYNSGNFFKNLGNKMISDTVTVQFKIVTN